MYITKTIRIIAAALVIPAVFTGSAFALDGDAEKGESVFKKCTSCHMVGPEAKNRVGPVLNELMGRVAGSYPDYKYGKSIVAAGEAGLIWTEDELFEYLENPKKYLRAKLEDKKAKSKMSFSLKKEDERANVIAYLKTFSPEAEAEATDGDTSSGEQATQSD